MKRARRDVGAALACGFEAPSVAWLGFFWWVLGTALGVTACATSGSRWMAEPLPNETLQSETALPPPEPEPTRAPAARNATKVIAAPDDSALASEAALAPDATLRVSASDGVAPAQGHSLGVFRNTYYDFPSEVDFEGDRVPLKNAHCETIAQVPRGFFESVCVQGSGTLRAGTTVSFSKRDCSCAELCPRTEQHICFDVLDPTSYPWGRGATGKAITPLVSVAVDTDVIPLGTPIYVPELDGLPRDIESSASHDGCFLAEDRGVRVKGKHLDIFTGHASITALWNRLVPSNRGVTVILESPRCARATPLPSAATPLPR